MALPKLNLPPAQAGYSATPESDTLRAKLGGGPSRFRRDVLSTVATVNVQWRMSLSQHAYLDAFLRSVVPGSLPFLVDLIVDGPDVAEYEARLIPDSKRLSGVQGLSRIVDAVLEVRRRPADAATDLAIVAIYGSFGDYADDFFNALDHLANEKMPSGVLKAAA